MIIRSFIVASVSCPAASDMERFAAFIFVHIPRCTTVIGGPQDNSGKAVLGFTGLPVLRLTAGMEV